MPNISQLALPTALLLGALAFTPGCETRAMPSDTGGVRTCTLDLDCNDGHDCTIESCGVGGICDYTTLDARCAMGESCVVGRGCVAGTTCTVAADCNDMIACTIDTCAVGGMCRHMPVNELCTDPLAPECDMRMGCIRGTGCMSPADCDDSITCTVDTCGVDRMCRHTGMDALCPMGQTCNITTGCFASMDCTMASECDDGNFCNGAERCDPKFGCSPGTPPACNDSDPCTIDSCAGMCLFTCDRSMPACSTHAGCETPAASCTGNFAISPAMPAVCAAGAAPIFSMTMFNFDGVVLTITDRASGFPDLTDALEPACPNFEASAVVDGGCRESYTMTGTFTDDDTFTGEFLAEYTDVDGFSCLLGGCRRSYLTPISGMRL